MEKEYVWDVYDTIADSFAETRTYLWQSVKDFTNDYIMKYNTVADIGCGNGKNMYRNDVYYTGYDICKKFCDMNPDKCIRADMCNIPTRDNTYDNIICVASFHHLATIERRIQCLDEMKRISKSGSTILLQVWIKNNLEPGDHFVKWSRKYKKDRYYHIFDYNEIETLLPNDLEIINKYTEMENIIYILKNNK